MDIETLSIAASWFSMVWFATTGILLIITQALLPRAWEAIRTNPPHGPSWAHNLWYGRTSVYAGISIFSITLGLIAAILYLLIG